MKKYLFIILLIILSFFIKIPKYIELNDLKIIEKVYFDCDKDIYYLTEVIPIRDDNGIEYNRKKYKLKYNDITNKYFLRDVKKISSNCLDEKEIKKQLKIKE